MNTQLVESLAQIINTLTPEEQELLHRKIIPKDWELEYQKLVKVREQIVARREGKPLEIDVTEIIAQMREERTEQLMEASFPELIGKKYTKE